MTIPERHLATPHQYRRSNYSAALALFIAAAIAPTPLLAVSQDLVVKVVPPACACGPGGSPNLCSDNSTPTAGSTVNVTLVCGPADGDRITWNHPYISTGPTILSAPIRGASTITVPLQVPPVASDRPENWQLALTGTDFFCCNLVGHSITVPPTISQTLGAALPASAGGDPFVPAHVVTVCPTGCNFTGPQPAIDSVSSHNPAWDNVEITVAAADYPWSDGGPNHFVVKRSESPNTPTHIWIKGIIGGSGTDGTVYPHFFGITNNSSRLFVNDGTETVWYDNLEFGPYNNWIGVPSASQTILRNVYVHDAPQGFITGTGSHNSVTVYNSEFARNGGNAGPEHNFYMGNGDDASTFFAQNSIFQQAYIGHDIKSRAWTTLLNCDKILLNQDIVFLGSEELDCSEGRICNVHNSVLVNGGANGAFNNDSSWDTIRFGADREEALLTNNYMDLQGSILVSDGGSFHKFLSLFRPMSPSPPYLVGGVTPNKFVFASFAQQFSTIGGYVQTVQENGSQNTSSNIVYGSAVFRNTNGLNTDLDPGSTAQVYTDRASAGLPAVGTYPKGPYDASIPAMPAACTEWVGRVKVPAS
jgi:hypothetical protein